MTQERNPERLEQPEFAQPLITALQLAQLAVLARWRIPVHCVLGHSSGEIAAAYAAGFISAADAVTIAYFCSRAAADTTQAMPSGWGVMGVMLSADALRPFLADPPAAPPTRRAGPASDAYGGAGAGRESLDMADVDGIDAYDAHGGGNGDSADDNRTNTIVVACLNSPSCVSLAGKRAQLDSLLARLQSHGHQAVYLRTALPYHHPTVLAPMSARYAALLEQHLPSAARPGSPATAPSPPAPFLTLTTTGHTRYPAMFSSVTGRRQRCAPDARHWATYIQKVTRFAEACRSMLLSPPSHGSREPDKVISPSDLSASGPTASVADSEHKQKAAAARAHRSSDHPSSSAFNVVVVDDDDDEVDDGGSPDFLLEVGPMPLLSAPVQDLLQDLATRPDDDNCQRAARVPYYVLAQVGPDATRPMFDAVRCLYAAGVPVDIAAVDSSDDYGVSDGENVSNIL